MPSYNDLRPDDDKDIKEFSLIFQDFPKEQKIRTINGLLKLRAYLAQNIQVKKTDKNLSQNRLSPPIEIQIFSKT